MKNKLWGLLIGLVLTVFFTFPLLTKFSSHLSSRQDGVLVAWLIDWGSQSLIENQNFFNAPFFYPYQNTIGYSDLFLPTAVLNIPIKFIQNFYHNTFNLTEPQLNTLIFNHNLHLFLGSILTFWGQYLLGLYLFKEKKLATLSGIIFAFSNMHLDYMAHLHVFLVAGIPFYFLFLFKFIDTKKTKYLLLTSLAIIYQLLNSPMSGLFLIVMSLISLVNKNIRKTLWENKKLISLYILSSALLVGFFYLPYFSVTKQFSYTRTIRDSAHFAFSLNKFLLPEIIFYLGLLFTLIKIKTKEKKVNINKNKLPKYFLIFLLFTILGALLMLGPALKINDQTFKILNIPIPLPYTLFYYLFPGFKAFRASSRWIIIFAFGLSIIISYLIKNIKLNKINKNTFLNTLLITTTSLLWITQVPQLKIFPINMELPAIYKVVKQRKEKVLAEFPTYIWSQTNDHYKESDRLLYQSYHQKKLYNGFSGFAPPERENLWHTISDNLNSDEMVQHLKDSKVELVLLHGDENQDYINFSSPNYQIITCKNKDCLYQLK
jgi:hypothetical protein